MVIVSNITTGD